MSDDTQNDTPSDFDSIETERRLHALLCGRCGEPDRTRLLEQLTHDQSLRDLLGEMIRTRELARAAYGYPTDDAALPETPTLTQLADLASTPAGTDRSRTLPFDERRGRALPRRRATWRRAFWRLAGAAVVAASIFLALDVHQTNVLLRRELSTEPGDGRAQALAIARVQPAELQRFMTIWSEVAGNEPGNQGRPWILMTGQNGQFGYLAGPAPANSAARPIVVRVLVVSDDGNVLEKSNVLLPRERTGQLTLADAGQLCNMPLGLEVNSSGSETTVGLKVGEGEHNIAGITGRVQVGREAEEIGRVKIGGRDLRVIVQALPLNGKPMS